MNGSAGNAAVIVAAGKGTRMGAGRNKVFLPLAGEPILLRTLRAFAESGLYDRLVVVTGEEDRAEAECLLSAAGIPALVYAGGADRQESVRLGLASLPDWDGLVSIHDGARPLVTREILEASLESAGRTGSGVAAVPVKDTIRRLREDGTLETPPREELRAMQTPQTFRLLEIRTLHERCRKKTRRVTDDAELLLREGLPVTLSPGSPENIKVTTREDLLLAGEILRRRECAAREEEEEGMRVGQGYDVHRLVPGRKLILCGVEVPYEKGLLGHSDADVALHALMDAMLGAAAM
nr:2-C-methyl-D-erythritol 4-phosphate cytidylyltransferase [Clostridiales bacterium]